MEDRNDPLVQKIRRYVNAFSKDGESSKEKEDLGKSDSGNHPEQSNFTKSDNRTNRRPRQCWQIIRQSIECEKEENVDSPDYI